MNSTPFLAKIAPAWILLVTIAATGCFEGPIEEAPPDVNLPPHISEEFTVPSDDVVQVETEDAVELGADALLDPDAEQQLHYAFIGDRSGLLEMSTATRRPTDERYRDGLVLFDGATVELDPCSPDLIDRDGELVRLFVTDRPFDRITDAGVEPADDAFLTSRRWLLRFRPHLCE